MFLNSERLTSQPLNHLPLIIGNAVPTSFNVQLY
jgi:hypothetical protein